MIPIPADVTALPLPRKGRIPIVRCGSIPTSGQLGPIPSQVVAARANR